MLCNRRREVTDSPRRAECVSAGCWRTRTLPGICRGRAGRIGLAQALISVVLILCFGKGFRKLAGRPCT